MDEYGARFVNSRDGTRIAYDRTGDGPPVVLVSGASVQRSANAALAELLSSVHTVFNYDRRGRGPSGDREPYAVAREIEDLEAVIDAAGGSAFVVGFSSGAALALEAAVALGPKIAKLVLWEAPYVLDPAARPPADSARQLRILINEDQRGAAVEYFLGQIVGMPPDAVAWARTQPFFRGQMDIAHTLVYDALVMGDFDIPRDRAAAVRCPTLVLAGGASLPFMLQTAVALAALIPGARRERLPDQAHEVDPAVLAPVLVHFFREASLGEDGRPA